MTEIVAKPSLFARAKAWGVWLWSFLGDPRSKNALIFLLLLATAFGMVAPDTATKLRDIILSMAF